MSFKLSEWNDLIKEINNIRQNPPDGCDPLDPIELFDNSKPWSVKEVKRVRDAVSEMCAQVEFTEDLTKTWRQSWIDEIRSNLAGAWCDCSGECPDSQEPIVFYTLPTETYCECQDAFYTSGPGGPTMGWREVGFTLPTSSIIGGTSLSSMINGLMIGSPGRCGRTWTVRLWTVRLDTNEKLSSVLRSGPVSPSGSVIYTDDLLIPKHWGASTFIPSWAEICGGSIEGDASIWCDSPAIRASFWGPLTYEIRLANCGEPCD